MLPSGCWRSMFHSITAAVTTTTATRENRELAIRSVEMLRSDLRSRSSTLSIRSIGTTTMSRSAL